MFRDSINGEKIRRKLPCDEYHDGKIAVTSSHSMVIEFNIHNINHALKIISYDGKFLAKPVIIKWCLIAHCIFIINFVESPKYALRNLFYI